MPEPNPLCGLQHCQHPLDPQQTDVQFVSPSESHYELMEIARQLEGIRLILQAMFDASQQLQAQAQDYLQNQQVHAESFMNGLNRPDYYPFDSLPTGTTVEDLSDGGRRFHLPDGIIIQIINQTVIVFQGGVMTEVPIGKTVLLPNGQRFDIQSDYLKTTHADAGIDGLPLDVEPECIGQGRYRVLFSDGIVLTAWHATAHQECMLSITNPTGGVLVISRKGIQGIGVEAKVRLLPDGALGFRVQPEAANDTVQYLHAGTAWPVLGIVEVALSNGSTITYRCSQTPNDSDDTDTGPVTFTCEERGQCSI